MPGADDMVRAVTDSKAGRTGRGLEDWVALVGGSGIDPLDQNAVRRWLKDVHGVEQNRQWAIADAAARAAGWERPTVEQYVDGRYTGARAGLRPVFDAVRRAAESLGDDAVVEGRGTCTPFVRRRQFAAAAPATATRLDLGLRYVDPPAGDRLQPARAPGSATHGVALTAVEDVDDEVRALLRAAYEQNG
ncbi:DUF5655 domain-containing protein [Geodermatophilus sp. SYSU D00815]